MTLEKTVKKYRELFKSKPVVLTAHTDKGHFYVSPESEELYHSVTYFTSFIKDPSLQNWKMNRALDYILKERAYLDAGGDFKTDEALSKVLAQAKLAPEGEFKGAGDIGTQTHNWRQVWFQEWIESGVITKTDEEIESYPLPQGVDPEVISGCRAIKRFLKETGAIPIACELSMVDDELKVGGMIDDLFVFPNKVKEYLDPGDRGDWDTIRGPQQWQEGGYKIKYHPTLVFVDLKTSNQGKKPAYAYQVRGFYQRMIWKTYHVKPKKTYILHTSKADGTYKLIDLTDMKFLEKDAQDLVRLSRSWDKVTESFKPKQIVI